MADDSVSILQEYGTEAAMMSILAMVLSLFSNDFLFSVPSDAEEFIRLISVILSNERVTLSIAVSCVVAGAVGATIGWICWQRSFVFWKTLGLKLHCFATVGVCLL